MKNSIVRQLHLMEKYDSIEEPIVFYDSFCPLCCTKRARFTCVQCVKNGSFCNSRAKHSEQSYEEKKKKLEIIKKIKFNYAGRVLENTKGHKQFDDLLHNVQKCRNKISILREAVTLLKQTGVIDQTTLTNLMEENEKRRFKIEKLKEKRKMKEKRKREQAAEIEKKQSELDIKFDEVTKLRRERVDQIHKYLFPISREKIAPIFGTPPDKTITENPVSDVIIESSDESCEVALTEATRISYVEGRWIHDDHSTNYKILNISLPINGDYSNYGHLLKSNKNGSSQSIPISNIENSLFSITAGLTYTSQLLELLAFFLDIILPKSLIYSEFCLDDLTTSQFRSCVSRLNTNVMYLCLSQNIAPQDLHSKRTLQNLYSCLHSNNIYLGRQGPHTAISEVQFNEDFLSDSESDSEIDSQLSSSSDNDWEDIKTVALTEDLIDASTNELTSIYPTTITTTTARDTTTTSTTTTTSLVSSVTALWPWKT